MDWEIHSEKKSDPNNRKNSKNQSEIAACEQKTSSQKMNFCSNTVFSLYFKIRANKIHAAKPLAFSLHFLFRCDRNHHSNLTSKIIKMCEQILKKHSSTSQNFHWLHTKTRPMNGSRPTKQKKLNQCRNVASKNRKPIARNVNLILTKN